MIRKNMMLSDRAVKGLDALKALEDLIVTYDDAIVFLLTWYASSEDGDPLFKTIMDSID